MFTKNNISRLALLLALCQPSVSMAEIADDFLDVPLDELGDIVTSVSKKPESSFRAPAAIYVLKQEDIRASGATSIPEALRMVPGLHVTRSDSEVWGITSRGFNDGFGNKLLVLMDGRSIYTPLFSGVYWDVQDTFMDDIERIEVIRGPGAALWGANAVNGVINIVTKKASQTQSTVVNTHVGKEEKFLSEGRYGGVTSNGIYYRMYAKRFNRDSSRTTTGADGENSWYSNRAGFRTDWDVNGNNSFTLQGDVYRGIENLTITTPNLTTIDDELRHAGGNIIGRWTHQYSEDSESVLQVYFDRTEFHYSQLKQDINTFDVDFQFSEKLGQSHDMLLGGGYRLISDDLRDTTIISYEPDSANRQFFNLFAQDTITVIPNTLHLTIGSKFEHNDYTGFEFQPNLRASWAVADNQTVWGSVARAVRTPSRSENDVSLAILPGFVRWEGNSEIKSEELTAYELGYRIKPTNNVSFDIATFYNDYDSLRTSEIGSNPPADTALDLVFANKAYGETYGIEVATEWDVMDNWKMNAGYTFLKINLHLDDDSLAVLGEDDENTSAEHQFNIRSVVYLPNNVELSGNVYYVDTISSYSIEPYIRADARIAWKPWDNTEISLVGFNLFDESHPEFAAPLHGTANEIERGYYAKVSLGF